MPIRKSYMIALIDRMTASIRLSLQLQILILTPCLGVLDRAGLDLRNLQMSRRCELTGKTVMTGNNVSHANNRTRRRFLPNLCQVTLLSDALGQKIRLKVSASALRTVEHRGGLDAFLEKAKEADLSLKAQRLKRKVAKARAEKEAADQAAA